LKPLRVSVSATSWPDHIERAIDWFERITRIEVARRKPNTQLEGSEAFPAPNAAGVFPISHPSSGVKLSVGGILGQPHPRSEGEKRLFERLSNDPHLRGIFECNQRVSSRYGHTYIVDLLSKALGIIVDIDGYEFHKSKLAFYRDRHRDFEMLVSNFVTLRIDHDEIMRDIEGVLEKIRSVVKHQS